MFPSNLPAASSQKIRQCSFYNFVARSLLILHSQANRRDNVVQSFTRTSTLAVKC